MPTKNKIDFIYGLCQKGDVHQLHTISLTKNFTVGEFFVGIPPNRFKEVTKLHIQNLYKTATILQTIRDTIFNNASITISPRGGWRDKQTQRELVKKGIGAVRSQHLLGNAVDINIKGYTAKVVQELLRSNRFIYTVGLGPNFTHIDGRIGIGEFRYG
jgi:uncharacterized protein YcbK (DUF882 family)